MFITLHVPDDCDVLHLLEQLGELNVAVTDVTLGGMQPGLSFQQLTGVPPDHHCFDRGQHDPDGPALKPGERVVGGRLLYSAAWL